MSSITERLVVQVLQLAVVLRAPSVANPLPHRAVHQGAPAVAIPVRSPPWLATSFRLMVFVQQVAFREKGASVENA